MSFIICDAARSDAPEILLIYNDVLQNCDAIYSEQVEGLSYTEGWMGARSDAGYPVFVAKDAAGRVLGYASYGQFRAREGYRFTIEHTVHVRSDVRGQGIGGGLVQALIKRAREDGYHVMIGAVDGGNERSIVFHEKAGFTRAGTLKQAGYRAGRWLDAVFMQIILDDDAA